MINYKLILSILLMACVSLQGITRDDNNATIEGIVIDQKTNEPIRDVNIIIHGTNIGTSTGTDGKYILENIPDGLQIVHFSHINYISQSKLQNFTRGLTYTMDVEMESRPIFLDEIEVVDTLPGRYRPGRVLGYNYDREDIERTGAVSFDQLIRSLVPQARVRESGGNLYIQLRQRTSITQRYARTTNPYPLIIIDGMQIGTSPIGLSGLLNPSDIEHLNVIRPPESQTIYGREAAHGAIVIETIDRSDEEPLLTPAQKFMVAGGLVALMILMNIIF